MELKQVIILIILSLILVSCVQEVNDFMWGKEVTAIEGITEYCIEHVSKIHVPYEPEPTVCNHEYHRQEWFPCLPNVCFDTIDAREARIYNLKERLYQQYLKTHNL